MGEALGETAVQAALTTRWLGRAYQYLESVGSTNDYLKQMLATDDAPDCPTGLVVLANFQSQGRGRLNRRWDAPPGTSLLFSILLRPDWPPEQANWLTMIGGLAVAEAVETIAALPAALKWPNDVLIRHDRSWRKVGGLLLEGEVSGNALTHVILGVGVNVNLPRERLPSETASSLLAAAGKPISRLALLVELLARLEARCETADSGQSPQPDWAQRLITLGQRVQVRQMGAATTLQGAAEAVDAWGRLLVRDERGQLHTVAAGDVTLRE